MTIHVDRKIGSGRGRYALDGSIEYRFEWQVWDDTGAELTGPVIKRLADIPELGRKLSGTSAICESISLDPVNNQNSKWDVEALFRTQETNIDPNSDQEDPRNQPAIIRFSAVEKQIVLEKEYDTDDQFGAPTKAVLNPANMPYDPPITDEESDLLIIIDKNYRAMDPSWIIDYKNTINLNDITIGGVRVGAKKGWMRLFTIEPGWTIDDEIYDMVHLEIQVSKKEFVKSVLALGFYYLETPSDPTTAVEIKLSDINPDTDAANDGPVTEPQKLAADGTLNIDGDPYFQQINAKFAKDWSPLNIPTTRDGTR